MAFWLHRLLLLLLLHHYFMLHAAGAFSGVVATSHVGYVSQFGNVSRQIPLTQTEGIAGMTGELLKSSRFFNADRS